MDSILNNIKKNDYVEISFKYENDMINIKGVIREIDFDNKIISLLNYIIPFNSIIHINKCCNN